MASTPAAGERPAVTRNLQFYPSQDDLIIELFKVPRRKFEDGSEIFRDMFAVPQLGSDVAAEGSSDDRPLVLEGIREEDFCAFLRALFAPRFSSTEQEAADLTTDECIAAFKLATQWCFDRIRRALVDELTKLKFPETDPARAIAFARLHNDAKGLLFPALLALARREHPPSLEEVEQIGVPALLKLVAVRESFVTAVVNGVRDGYYGSAHKRAFGGLYHQGSAESPDRANFDFGTRI